MKTYNILDLVEHNTFIEKKTRLDYKNMYIISYKNPLSLPPQAMNKQQRLLCADLCYLFCKDIPALSCYAIFSYETLVAYILYDSEHRDIMLLRTNKHYSSTTSKQLTQLENTLFMYNHPLSYDYTIESQTIDFSMFDN